MHISPLATMNNSLDGNIREAAYLLHTIEHYGKDAANYLAGAAQEPEHPELQDYRLKLMADRLKAMAQDLTSLQAVVANMRTGA